MLGVELELIDLPVCEVLDQFEKRFETRDTATRNIQHHAAAQKVSIIANFQTRQPSSELAQELAKSCDCRAKAILRYVRGFVVLDRDAGPLHRLGRCSDGARHSPDRAPDCSPAWANDGMPSDATKMQTQRNPIDESPSHYPRFTP